MSSKKLFYAGIFILLSIFAFLAIRHFSYVSKTPAGKLIYLLNKKGMQRPNVVLFTLDTTRADHLPVYGYSNTDTPTISSMARKGIVFEHCITPTPLTLPSHASIMTGMYPIYHGIRINGVTALSDENITLAEEFKRAGYNTSAFIAAFVLDGRWGLKQGFDHYDDNFDLEKYKTLDLGKVQIPANEVIDKAIKWLDKHAEEPFFTWIHLYDPHVPYSPPEPYLSEYGKRGMVGLYDGEIAFMDSQIGRFINWLKSKGVYRNTIFVFVGDHGEGLGEHGEQTHGYFIYNYAIHVPLIVVIPLEKFQGKRIKAQVRTIDIFPTLLEMIGLEVPPATHGKSLLPLIFNPGKGKDRPAYSEAMAPQLQYNWAALYGLRIPPYQYIDAPKPEFYNIIKDPKELNNIIKPNWILAKRYREKLYKLIEETSRNAIKTVIADVDSETMKKLATLGYLGVTSTKDVSLKENRKLPDPKDMLHLFNLISQAAELISEGNNSEAVEVLKKVVIEDPNNPQARLLLASSYTKLGELDKAKRELEYILKQDPDDIKALITLANIVFDQGKFEDVVIIGKRILEIDGSNVQAMALIGRALESQDKLNEALGYFERAVEIQPKLMVNWLELAKCQISMKNYQEAMKSLKMILAKHPKFPTVHYHLGLIYERLGNIEAAKEEYRKEIENYKKYIPARFNYAMLIFKDNLDEYINQLRKTVEIDPKFARGYLFLGRGLLYKGADTNLVEETINNGISLTTDPKLKALGYYLLADLYARTGDSFKLNLVLGKARFYEAKIRRKK